MAKYKGKVCRVEARRDTGKGGGKTVPKTEPF